MINLRKFIRLLIESSEIEELEKKYEKEIALKKYNEGSYELHNIIHEFEEISKKFSAEDSLKEIEKKLKENNYELLGTGNWRKVYSKKDVNFIIKILNNPIEQSDKLADSLTWPENSRYTQKQQEEFRFANKQSARGNQIEYNKSIEHGTKYFTKQYAVDEKYNNWVILEKVNRLDNKNIKYFIPNFYKLYPELFACFINTVFKSNITINDVLAFSEGYNEIFFELSFVDSFCFILDKMSQNKFKLSDIYLSIFESLNESQILDELIQEFVSKDDIINAYKKYEHLIEKTNKEYKLYISKIHGSSNYDSHDLFTSLSNKMKVKQKNEFEMISDIIHMFENLITMKKNDINTILNDIDSQLNISLDNLPELKYLQTIVLDSSFKDIHIGNMGYRNNELNKNKPWKNIIIMDYGN